jgi:peptidyl-dipeptidase A
MPDDKPLGGTASAFIDHASTALETAEVRSSRARWVYNTHITSDTEQIAAEAYGAYLGLTAELAAEAARHDDPAADPAVRRQLHLLKIGLASVAPDAAGNAELSATISSLQRTYSTGRHAPAGREPLNLDALERILAVSRDPDELLDVWSGWHTIGRSMRDRYARFVELSNAGARSLGFADTGERWRSGYDMAPDAFAETCDRLWREVAPLYRSLHAFVRRRLGDVYGRDVVPADGPIPVHLLGNMWAQDWANIAPLVRPEAASTYDLTALLESAGYDAVRMMRTGEAFFTSLGLDPLPETFWTRSMIVRPRDREVVCHASAWTVDDPDDLRIKMCTEVTGEDFVVVHHELGHLVYDHAYRHQPTLFRGGANDGFHEAIGDAIAHSVTPDYLVRIGLLDEAPGADADIPLLLDRALQFVPRLPWELTVDRWRWEVFSGATPFERWTARWWELRRELSGVAPAVTREEADFDPGAKYHIPSNVPYIRYYLATFLEYQFHKALTEAAGLDGPLHRRSIYGSRAAGERLNAMMAMGASRPWPDALEAIAGTREMSGAAILEYFAPLQAWLDEQNEGAPIGW